MDLTNLFQHLLVLNTRKKARREKKLNETHCPLSEFKIQVEVVNIRSLFTTVVKKNPINFDDSFCQRKDFFCWIMVYFQITIFDVALQESSKTSRERRTRNLENSIASDFHVQCMHSRFYIFVVTVAHGRRETDQSRDKRCQRTYELRWSSFLTLPTANHVQLPSLLDPHEGFLFYTDTHRILGNDAQSLFSHNVYL